MNIKKLIREELDAFDWVDKEIIPIGSCVTVKQCSFVSRHIHKLYPDRDKLSLNYIVIKYDGDDMVIKPESFPDEERFYKRIDRDTMEDNLGGGVTFCHR